MTRERAVPSLSAAPADVPQWDVLAAELRAYRDQQRQTWGDLDSALIGRYLAGEVSSEEREQVETAFQDHPDLRLLTDLIHDVLSESSPVAPLPPSEIAEKNATEPAPLPQLFVPPPPSVDESKAPLKREETSTPPRVLSVQRTTRERPVSAPFWRARGHHGALAAAACLLLLLGVALVQRSDPVQLRTGHRGGSPQDLTAMNRKGVATAADFRERPLVASLGSGVRRELAVALTSVRKELDRIQDDSPSTESIDRVTSGVETWLAAAPSAHNGAFAPGLVGKAPPLPAFTGPLGAAKRADPAHPDIARSLNTFFELAPAASRVLDEAVPVLVSGVQQERVPELQTRCGKALVGMGPRARPAVPALIKTLEKTRNPRQQQIVVNVLKHLGPAAHKAVPTLETLAAEGSSQVRLDAREALHCICAPQKPTALEEKELKIRELAGLWAKLPPRERAMRLRELTQELPPRYRDVIQHYFLQLNTQGKRGQ